MFLTDIWKLYWCQHWHFPVDFWFLSDRVWWPQIKLKPYNMYFSRLCFINTKSINILQVFFRPSACFYCGIIKVPWHILRIALTLAPLFIARVILFNSFIASVLSLQRFATPHDFDNWSQFSWTVFKKYGPDFFPNPNTLSYLHQIPITNTKYW